MVSQSFNEHTDSPVKVGLADHAVVSDDTVLMTSGLGSCVAVILHDPENNVSGLLHAMLPTNTDFTGQTRVTENRSKYVDSGVTSVLTEMKSVGASSENIVGWIIGGSEMIQFTSNEFSIGERNVKQSKDVFTDNGITLVDEDVGGGSGRSVSFHPASRTVTVKSGTEEKTL